MVGWRLWTGRGWGEMRQVAWPAVLLLFSGFFLLGRIGFWSDDYWHNLRDPASGALPPLTLDGLTISRGFFLRPLYYAVVPALTTLAWETHWPAHLVQVLTHGAVVLLLWRLMRRLGVGTRTAAACAMLFMVYPAHFEAVLWTAAWGTGLSSALMLTVLLGQVRWVQTASSGWTWRNTSPLLWMPALTFAACCLNEQPATAVLALPMIAWLMPTRDVPADREATDEATSRSRVGMPEGRGLRSAAGAWVRTHLPAGLCVGAAAAYAAMVWLDPDRPAGTRVDQFTPLSQLPARAAYFADVLWRRLVLKNFASGAWELGVSALWEAWPMTAAWAVALTLAAAAWLRWWCVDATRQPPAPSPASRTIGCPLTAGALRLALFAAAMFVLGWAPILVQATYEPDSRTRYWPAVALAVLLAGVVEGTGRLASAWRTRAEALRSGTRYILNALGASLLLAVGLVGSVMFVGIQRAFQARWRLDGDQARQLRALVPDPRPYSFFVPLEIRTTGIRTGAPVFDAQFRSVWEWPWTVPKFIMGVYGRTDVRGGYWRHWTPGRPVAGASVGGLHYTDVLGPRYPRIPGSGSRIPWELAIPFIIDADSGVRLVTTIVTNDAGGGEHRWVIPQARHAPELIWHLPRR